MQKYYQQEKNQIKSDIIRIQKEANAIRERLKKQLDIDPNTKTKFDLSRLTLTEVDEAGTEIKPPHFLTPDLHPELQQLQDNFEELIKTQNSFIYGQ